MLSTNLSRKLCSGSLVIEAMSWPRSTMAAKYRRFCASVPSAATNVVTVECMLKVRPVAEQPFAISRSAWA